MANFESTNLKTRGSYPASTSRQQGATTTQFFDVTVPAGTDLDDDDRILFGILPENNVLCEMQVHVPDIDTGSSVVLNYGLFNDDGDYSDVDEDAYISGSTAGRAAGLVRAPDESAYLDTHSAYKRMVVGAKLSADPAGNPNTARRFRGWYSYKPKEPWMGSGID